MSSSEHTMIRNRSALKRLAETLAWQMEGDEYDEPPEAGWGERHMHSGSTPEKYLLQAAAAAHSVAQGLKSCSRDVRPTRYEGEVVDHATLCARNVDHHVRELADAFTGLLQEVPRTQKISQLLTVFHALRLQSDTIEVGMEHPDQYDDQVELLVNIAHSWDRLAGEIQDFAAAHAEDGPGALGQALENQLGLAKKGTPVGRGFSYYLYTALHDLGLYDVLPHKTSPEEKLLRDIFNKPYPQPGETRDELEARLRDERLQRRRSQHGLAVRPPDENDERLQRIQAHRRKEYPYPQDDDD